MDSSIAFNIESKSENIINILFVSQVLMKSKARSTVFASGVIIDEPSGTQCFLQLLSDIAAQPTFEYSFDPFV